jgi:hypothetical protein
MPIQSPSYPINQLSIQMMRMKVAKQWELKARRHIPLPCIQTISLLGQPQIYL